MSDALDVWGEFITPDAAIAALGRFANAPLDEMSVRLHIMRPDTPFKGTNTVWNMIYTQPIAPDLISKLFDLSLGHGITALLPDDKPWSEDDRGRVVEYRAYAYDVFVKPIQDGTPTNLEADVIEGIYGVIGGRCAIQTPLTHPPGCAIIVGK